MKSSPPLVRKKLSLVDKFLWIAVDIAAERDRRRATVAVATDKHQLRASKEIRHDLRVGLLDNNAAIVQADIGKNRAAHHGVKTADGFVDGLAWPHIGRRAAVVLGQVVKQIGIDVVANAKGKDTGVGGHGAATASSSKPVSRDAFGGQAIGDKNDRGRPFRVCLSRCFEQSGTDIRSPNSVQTVDK